MSEEQDKKTSQVSDAAAVKPDIPAKPTALADEELDKVTGGAAINTSRSNIKHPN